VVPVVGDERRELIDDPAPEALAAEVARRRMTPRLRLAVLTAAVVLMFVTLRVTGVVDSLSPESLRALLAGAGILGVIGFVLAFSVGLLAQLPGLLFIAVAVLAYGRAMGALVALLGAVVAVSVTFVVVRRFGGSALAEIESPFMRRVLSQLDTRPLRSVIVLRAVFGVAPFLNYALALSSLGFRDYLIGSVIGMTAPITIAALILDAAL
jgi:uncharacterized membrane protein YdjX (TVP38/TMEM64 family)